MACRCAEEVEGKEARVAAILEKHRGHPGELITVLHQIQEIYGYVSREMQIRVAEALNIPASEVSGVVSFYALFSTKPKGKHQIKVCKGTACYVRGSERVLERISRELGVRPGDTTDDGEFSLEVVRCLGACGLAPVIMVDGDVYARLETDKVSQVLASYRAKAPAVEQ